MQGGAGGLEQRGGQERVSGVSVTSQVSVRGALVSELALYHVLVTLSSLWGHLETFRRWTLLGSWTCDSETCRTPYTCSTACTQGDGHPRSRATMRGAFRGQELLAPGSWDSHREPTEGFVVTQEQCQGSGIIGR